MPFSVFPQTSVPPEWTLENKQLLWEQLNELRELRIRVKAYEDYISPAHMKAVEDAYEMKIQAQQGMIELRTQERDFAREKAAFYEAAYKAAVKPRGGIGCKLKRIFTFGISRPCK